MRGCFFYGADDMMSARRGALFPSWSPLITSSSTSKSLLRRAMTSVPSLDHEPQRFSKFTLLDSLMLLSHCLAILSNCSFHFLISSSRSLEGFPSTPAAVFLLSSLTCSVRTGNLSSKYFRRMTPLASSKIFHVQAAHVSFSCLGVMPTFSLGGSLWSSCPHFVK